MKRLLITIFIALIYALNATPLAFADDDAYLAKPVSRECYFFSDKDLSTALFAVPYTYCVQVIKEDGEWLYASYADDVGNYKKVYGYCRSEEFEKVTSKPKSQYLIKTVTVTFSASVGAGAFNPPQDLQVEAAYYGDYKHGANSFSYVLCRNSFCYIMGANGDYPLNEYENQTNDDGAKEDKNTPSNNTALIIFIVILVAALIAVGGVAFSPKRNKD